MLKEKMSRYKKSILSVCFGVLTLAISVCSFSFPSLAYAENYSLNYAEPAKSETQGYVLLALQNRSTGKREIITFFWNSFAMGDYGQVPCSVKIDINGSDVSFSPYTNLGYAESALVTITRVTPEGVFVPMYPSVSTETKVSWSYYMAGYTLLGHQFGGNAIGDYSYPQSYEFSVYFSEDRSYVELMRLYSLIQTSNNLTASQTASILDIVNSNASIDSKLAGLKDYVDSIREDLADIEDKLQEIIEEQKEHKTWLQKIWEALTGSDSDKEKIEEEKGKAEEQASQLEGLNEQNKTDKVDPSQAQDSVNGAIDNNQIQNYSVVLSVFTHDSHIGQMMLIVIALTLVSYVLFGKK